MGATPFSCFVDPARPAQSIQVAEDWGKELDGTSSSSERCANGEGDQIGWPVTVYVSTSQTASEEFGYGSAEARYINATMGKARIDENMLNE